MNVMGDGDKINGKIKYWKINLFIYYIKNKYISILWDGY